MNNRISLLIATALLTLAQASYAAEKHINFDDASGSTGSSLNTISDGYNDLTWKNFIYTNPFAINYYFYNSGAATGVVSLNFVASNGSGQPASFGSSSPFNLNSAYFTAAFNDGLHVTVEGISNDIITHTLSFDVNTTTRSFQTFNWNGIDSVLISSSGGTPGSFGDKGTYFIMDNLVLSSVPETEIYAMLLAGLGLVGFMARRRNISSK